ncbi:MAG: hypothetical protein CVU59_03085 [Deltaproteobacteria bacterium HGW-Deltaproteobacteria-17]|nr:MAG: hypothetical protein CVU59_03085 [Deltaproteobacteria bacterium HGW-Deltaproteobacteria-17]
MPDFNMDSLTSNPPPRDPAFCSVMTGHFAPWYGFLGFGVLWFFVAGAVTGVALLLEVLILSGVVSQKPFPAWIGWLLTLGALVTFLLAWWPFARFVRRHRGEARRLFRDGQVLAGTFEPPDLLSIGAVFNMSARTRGTRARVRFDVEGISHTAEFFSSRPIDVSPARPCSVLFEPGCPYVAVVPREGGFVPARWRRG